MKLQIPKPPRLDWRALLARLPLPMLALAASYGVYSYALLFVPEWVAVVQAAAFECTYIGLAVTRTLDLAGRRRATAISLGAVTASIIYNTLAGWFHAQPAVLAGADDIAWLCLAVLHGAPLAWVAFLVASLLLHQQDDLETRIANDTQLLASTTADLAIVRESETALRERLATIEAGAASHATEAASLRTQLANDRRLLATQEADIRGLRESLRTYREDLAELRERPPTQAQLVAYVQAQLANGQRSLLEISREIGFSESTVRGWVKAATNGHLVEG